MTPPGSSLSWRAPLATEHHHLLEHRVSPSTVSPSTRTARSARTPCSSPPASPRTARLHAPDIMITRRNMFASSRFGSVLYCGPKLQWTKPMNVAARGLKTGMAFPTLEISVSAYDTAWVAMVPSRSIPLHPCFPECLEWILKNQHSDGSWPVPDSQKSLLFLKEALSLTLACIIALEQWNIGKVLVRRGISFIRSNINIAVDDQHHSPIGFNIIFPGMLKYAIGLGLEIPVSKGILDAIFNMHDLELKRGFENKSKSWEAHLAYTLEGFGNALDWQTVMKFQRKNGSLFNSPSATAAALVHNYDARSIQYLQAALSKHGNAVPSVYPLDIYTNLCMIDSLEKLGITCYFDDYIGDFLSKTYRSWLLKEEEIHSDITTCVVAFRLLRMHGYNVSSDVLANVEAVGIPWSALDRISLHDVNIALEFFRASQLKISQMNRNIEKFHSLNKLFLKQFLFNHSLQDEFSEVIIKEVEHALNFPFYANLDFLEHKRCIENYRVENVLIRKSCIVLRNDCKDVLGLAVKEFNSRQSIFQNELRFLERWFTECRLDQLKFARQKLVFCYFSAAATLFLPEMADARISWAKNSVLTTVIDDFFDVGGTKEELAGFQNLLTRWDANYEKSSYSDHVNIIFSALYSTVIDLGKRAYSFQGYNITRLLVDIWVALTHSMMEEYTWLRDGAVPTLDEYMTNGCVSFALGPIILPTLYFVGPKLSMGSITEPECHYLFRLVSTCGRLLNDIQGFERERKEGKLNSVTLYTSQNCVTEDDAKRELMGMIHDKRTELFRMVLHDEAGGLPRKCRDVFWKMSKVLHFFYARNDGFTSPTEIMNAVNAVIFEPLKLPDELASPEC